MDRRDFMKGVVGVGLGAVGARLAGAQDGGVAPADSATRAGAAPLETRSLGKTGWKPTILGFGGYSISEVGEEPAIATIEAALEAGINYFDTASTYGDHKSEGYLGKVLPHRKRETFFLTTKTLKRTRAEAEKEIATSLSMLGVAPDLLQLHAINDVKTLETVMRKGGSFEAAIAAKEAGRVKHVGITGHTRPEAILKALDMHPFDTVLIPLGAPDWHVRSFEDVIAKAREKGAGVIGMKVLSGGHAAGKMDVTKLLHYTWNLPVDTAILGMRTKDEVRAAVAAARAFKPLTADQVAAIRDEAKPIGTTDVLWWKRVS